MKTSTATVPPPSAKRCRTVSALLSPAQHKALKQRAGSSGITTGDFILQALIEKLESASIPACPLCRQSDRIEIIEWNNERHDGTEYQGTAVRCNRCDAIAPLRAWMGRAAPQREAGAPLPPA
jgi:hypothetical protein